MHEYTDRTRFDGMPATVKLFVREEDGLYTLDLFLDAYQPGDPTDALGYLGIKTDGADAEIERKGTLGFLMPAVVERYMDSFRRLPACVEFLPHLDRIAQHPHFKPD